MAFLVHFAKKVAQPSLSYSGIVRTSRLGSKAKRGTHVLDLGLHVVDGVAGLHIQSDGLACESLHENLHGAQNPLQRHEGRL